MTTTPHLGLPLLAAAQAQKHVTHNEALFALDALVQCAISDKDLSAPPVSPAEGARYIVGPSPTGLWAGKASLIVLRQDGAWLTITPQIGFIAYVIDEALLYVFTSGGWKALTDALTAIQNLGRLGIGTTADAANPFSAKLNAALWTARGTGEGGTGDLRYTLNKESTANILSLLFQTGYSGRLEIGLVGSDNVVAKVSPNGTTWRQALAIDAGTGAVDVLSPEATIASAGTVDLGAQPSRRLAITGTTTITSFGASPDKERILRFVGAPTITHNPTSLILPGGANIVTEAGDTALVVSDGSGNWMLSGYQRAARTPGSFAPAANQTYDLGSASLKYRDVFSAKFTVDPSFYIAFVGGSPAIAFDSGDYQYYDRTNNGYVWVINSNTSAFLTVASFSPGVDNVSSIGGPALRWSTVYAGTGSINTSDQTTKTPLRGFTDAELDAWGEVNGGVFQFLASVAQKGEDRARLHFGYTAQGVAAALEAHGIDPSRCALWCLDELTERAEVDETSTEDMKTGETRLGLRYDQCAVIESAYQRRRADRLEARMAAIEAALSI